MIRRFILGVLCLAFAVGCGYYWWQSWTLNAQVRQLKSQVEELHTRLHAVESHRHGASQHSQTSVAASPVPTNSVQWLQSANQHMQNCADAADRAKTEYAAAVDAYHHATAAPIQDIENGLAAARQKLSTVESDAEFRGETLQSGRITMTKWPILPAVGLICLAVVLLPGCKTGSIGGPMSTGDERDLGARYAAELDKQVKYVDDSKTNARILQIALPIFGQANRARTDVTFRIRIIDDKEVNAFSIPGGYIYINKGLLDKLGDDDDAVACVIGHECAHIVRRHVVKQIADSEDKGLLVGVAAVLTRSNVVNDVGGALVDLQQLHFSRQDEYEADRFGERFAYNAGFDPAGMLRTFHILEDVEKTGGGHDPTYARDHPITRNRALRALEQWRELKANHGQYVSDGYNPTGDQIAAKENGIDYPALVLATSTVNINTLPQDAHEKSGQAVQPASGGSSHQQDAAGSTTNSRQQDAAGSTTNTSSSGNKN